MQKDFDDWCERKKDINDRAAKVFYHKREIWWCSLGVNIGFEQDGTGTGHERPVLIIRGFSALVCLIIPLTTSAKKNPYHVDVGIVNGRLAFAIISQLRLVDTRRLVERIGYLEKGKFETIRKAVRDLI
ncbi:MAG TPA: type II toxin-antitoxin system PemK/MazF family toxin [Candidatus Paceibacterota bacterium]